MTRDDLAMRFTSAVMVTAREVTRDFWAGWRAPQNPTLRCGNRLANYSTSTRRKNLFAIGTGVLGRLRYISKNIEEDLY
jgi:hypothetical protein